MPSDPSQLAVLIVDDAEDCIATLDVALQTLPGIVVRSVGTAEAALAVLERETISAVITDLQLPFMNGLELIAFVRKQANLRSVPIVAVSAAADPAIPKAALELGANAFFPKPFSPGAVRKKLEELIYAR
jgi:CheY-like chemotaxis protein